ncbi:ABC transporter substrate-binding protein [Pararobbsia silviterrae]|uniref:ABC transporter substrate-binding protein n=1 Tax=Pararobbsia silviterrae TaxID=1792498 RepID=A0A494XZY5_9BURK|nr:ABC transporter substrate-binding protein [Pararobbsia silviterrae]RKP53756.1 ABC transporter substrate-binding protein [Pararobbsia silviterrae]
MMKRRILRAARMSASATSTVLAALGIVGGMAAAHAATGPEPYRIGYLVDASGSEQQTIKPSLDGLNLYIDQVNRQGGVNGRPVEIVVRDTRSDLQQSLDAVASLAQLGVSGIAGMGISSTHGPVYAAAQRVGLPVIAAFPATTPVVLPPAKPNAYGVGLAFNVTAVVAGHFARQVSPQGKRLVCVGFESAGSMLACATLEKTARAEGFSDVETLTVPVGHLDFRAVVERINASSPDVVADCLNRAQVAAFLPALTHSNYHGVFLSMDSAIGDAVLRDATPAGSGTTVYSYGRYVTGSDGTGPQVDAYRRAVAAAGRGAPSSSLAAGWTMGLVITDALKRCAGACDAQQFNASLNHVDVDTGGLTGEPVRFTATDHYGPSAYRLYRYDAEAQQFSSVGDWVHVDSSGRLIP